MSDEAILAGVLALTLERAKIREKYAPAFWK
jgi:hypothetical protein